MILNENQRILQENSMFLSEAVKYDFWGSFRNFAKDHPDIEALKRDIEKAERIARSNDEFSIRSNRSQGLSVFRKIVQVYFNLDATLQIIFGPFSLFFGWIVAAIDRALVHLAETSEYEDCKKDAIYIMEDLQRVAAKTKDPKKKKEFEEMANKIKETINRTSER